MFHFSAISCWMIFSFTFWTFWGFVEGGIITSFSWTFLFQFTSISSVLNINTITSWGWALPSSGPTSCQFILSGTMPVLSSSSQVVFLSGYLPVRLSSCQVVFLSGHLPFRLSSCQVVFLSICLPVVSSPSGRLHCCGMVWCDLVFVWCILKPFKAKSRLLWSGGWH